MASRLSEDSVKAAYDAGHQAIAIQNDASLQLLTPTAVDLNELLLAEDPQAAVQAVEPLALYQALKLQGVEDYLDILPLMSGEQVQRTFDYEAWDGDRLEPLKTCRWLMLFKEVGDEEMAQRFKGLEEEFQLALLSPLIEVIDEDAFEKLPADEQDLLHRLPCNTLYFRIKTADNRVEGAIDALVDAMLQIDINYTYAMLAHATYVPPTEQEDLAGRFRRARIEEDGFVSYEESLQVFFPINLAELEQRWHTGTAGSAAQLAQANEQGPFLVAAMQHGARCWNSEEYSRVTAAFAFLGNTLAAAAKVETDELAAMKKVLAQAQALAGLGLEHLSNGNLDLAVKLLGEEHPKTLFRAGLALIARLQEQMLEALADAGLKCAAALQQLWRLGRYGALLVRLDQDVMPVLGLRRTEILRGLFNRFPVRPVAVAPVDDGSAERTLFAPIATRAALFAFAGELAGMRGVLHVAGIAGAQGSALHDLDRRLATAMARSLLGQAFTDAPLDSRQLRELTSLPAEAAQALTSDMFATIETSVHQALADDAQKTAGIQAAMTELSDLAMSLHIAREHDKRQADTTSALLAIVDGGDL